MNLSTPTRPGLDILSPHGLIPRDDLSLLSMLVKEYFLNVSIKLLYLLPKIGIENRHNSKFLNDKEFKIAILIFTQTFQFKSVCFDIKQQVMKSVIRVNKIFFYNKYRLSSWSYSTVYSSVEESLYDRILSNVKKHSH